MVKSFVWTGAAGLSSTTCCSIVARLAFDLLMADGQDLRMEKLTDRKQELRRLLLGVSASRLQYVDHIHERGTALFERVCKLDLEGIVAKHSYGPYVTDPQKTTWVKIKNRNYSQMQGREELSTASATENLLLAGMLAIWRVLSCSEGGMLKKSVTVMLPTAPPEPMLEQAIRQRAY